MAHENMHPVPPNDCDFDHDRPNLKLSKFLTMLDQEHDCAPKQPIPLITTISPEPKVTHDFPTDVKVAMLVVMLLVACTVAACISLVTLFLGGNWPITMIVCVALSLVAFGAWCYKTK